MSCKPTATKDKTTEFAERIGRTLAKVVNRLESLDDEREKSYNQLLTLQARLNTQVARLVRTIDRTAHTGGTRPAPVRPAATRRPRAAKSSSKPTATKRGGAKKTITCGICGTRGHNARGHAKWQASRNH